MWPHSQRNGKDYYPQSEAALQNFKTLVVLEISLFLGGDIEWATSPGADD
jgi:hypothetical protein